ncbi:MAG: ankyrin repeat domain-containing protein [Candidatus Nanopelagicales bacterium]
MKRRRRDKTPVRPTPGLGGRIPLHHAAGDTGGDRADLVAELIASGQDPNTRDYQGNTPLHFAGQYTGVDVVRILIDAGAEVDAQNVRGETPLYMAVNSPWTSADVLRLLRERGADPGKKTANGSSPLDYVRAIDSNMKRDVFADLLDGAD